MAIFFSLKPSVVKVNFDLMNVISFGILGANRTTPIITIAAATFS